VHMPRMDGYQLAQAIRADEAREGRARTPVVALTAAALKGESDRCLAAGMDDYLAKPVGIPALAAMLARWLPHAHPAPPPAGTPAPTFHQVHRPPPLDPDVLAQLTHDDPAETRALLDDFLASSRADLATLERAVAEHDHPGATREAHKIKGAARIVGALELAEAADVLESAARAGDAPLVPALATDVATALHRLALHVDQRWPH